jgi:sugar phosphate isomerase/epimerase
MIVGFPNNPRKNILAQIKWIAKNGFDFIDLFLEEDLAVPEKNDVAKIKNLLRKHKLEVVGHTACYFPIGSPIKSLREATIAEIEKYFSFFMRLDVEFVTVHANWAPNIFSEKESLKFQIDTLKKMVKLAKKYGIRLMYEPINTGNDTLKNVDIILKMVPDLSLHLDIGHANLFGRNPEDFIKKFHKKIKHIHLHDNDGKDDLHLPIRRGNINWEKLINVLKKHYDGTITLEIFSGGKKELLESRKKLKELWMSG